MRTLEFSRVRPDAPIVLPEDSHGSVRLRTPLRWSVDPGATANLTTNIAVAVPSTHVAICTPAPNLLYARKLISAPYVLQPGERREVTITVFNAGPKPVNIVSGYYIVDVTLLEAEGAVMSMGASL